MATARAILHGGRSGRHIDFGRRYPNAGYGGNFYRWLGAEGPQPYNSWGNGSAMRVAPVDLACCDVVSVLREAERSTDARSS